MNKLTPALIAAALFGLAGSAAANEDQVVVKSTATTTTQTATTTTMTKPDFATLDVDSDGSIVLIEVDQDQMLSSKFSSYDIDRDGKLSPSEFDDYVAAEIDVDSDIEVDDD